MKYKSGFLVTLHCLKIKGLRVGGEEGKRRLAFGFEFIYLGYSHTPESQLIGRKNEYLERPNWYLLAHEWSAEVGA